MCEYAGREGRIRKVVIIQLLLLAILVLVIPATVGGLTAGVDKSLPFRWISGQFLLWAGFEVICVPMVLTKRTLGDLAVVFLGFMAAMVLLSLAVGIQRHIKAAPGAWKTEKANGKKDIASILLWLCAALLLVLQLVLAVLLAYEEGDDAFYVAISAAAESSGAMYLTHPYTGAGALLDMRHALAPFPMWEAFLARLTGMRTVIIVQAVLPVILILMSYAVYFLMGKRLFRNAKRKQAVFLLLLEILILFGGYSLQSAENFLLVRTGQGKAVLANIVIPFLFLMLLDILEELQQRGKNNVWKWVAVAAAIAAGCLCSLEGTLLTCMLLGLAGVCMLVCYRQWKLILPMAGCSVVPVCIALLYLWMH